MEPTSVGLFISSTALIIRVKRLLGSDKG
jgi:hypothetical protein